VSSEQKLGCQQDQKMIQTKIDVQKEVCFSPDIIMQMRLSYADVVRKGMDEKHP
jgi:hypothetical protein